MQEEWIQLVRGKGENIPPGREGRSKGREGGKVRTVLRTKGGNQWYHVCKTGREGRGGEEKEMGQIGDRKASDGGGLVRAWL